MSALRGIAAIMAGVGTGLVARKEDDEKKARQAKYDAWQEEQRNRQRAEWSEKDALKTSMKDAFADRSTIEGTAVTGADNKILERDPAQLAVMQKIQSDVADLEGTAPVTAAPATGVVSNATRGHQITTGPVDLKALNSSDAKWGRAVSAMMPFDPEKALSMENALMEGRAKKLNLDVAQLKHLNSTYNQTVFSKLNDPSGDFFDNAAKMVTDAQFGGLVGATGRVERSADGKTVSIIVAKDGKDVRTIQLPNSAEGRKQLSQRFMKADDATQLSFLKDDADREASKAKAAAEQEEKDRQFRLDQEKLQATKDYQNGMLGVYRQRAANTGAAASQQVGANWEDRRKVLDDASKLLPDPNGAASPEAAALIRAENTALLGQIDSIFQTNADFGMALTSPQINQALVVAKDPKNVIYRQDQNTGQVVKMVKVSGREVIVGFGAGPASKKPDTETKADTQKPVGKKPIVYDPALKAVVDAMATPPKPVVIGPGSIDHMRRAFQKSNAIN